jgi:phosphate transport system protein
MVEKFHAELEMLKEHTLEMGSLSRTMLQMGTRALESQDEALGSWVSDKREDLVRWDDSIEEDSLRLMALYQPMAKDLRTIACTLKMITYLTRVGIYGKDIAVVRDKVAGMPPVHGLFGIPKMTGIVCSMVDAGLDAYAKETIAPIQDIGKRDDEVDALFFSTLNECIAAMTEDPERITVCTNYILVARYLERCGDNACKMAEKIHYMVTGERIEID